MRQWEFKYSIMKGHLFVFFLAVILLRPSAIFSQVPGCTDPLATNYNAAATQNDGSCQYAAATITPVSSVLLPNTIDETSGLILWNQRLWTHNDDTQIYIYDVDTLTGIVQDSMLISGVTNTDWEELSQDSNYVYIGDFGNNLNGNRTDLKILRVSKSSLLSGQSVTDTIAFSYSEQTVFTPAGADNTDFDCEAMIVAGDSIYLFTKQWLTQKTDLYVMPKAPGTYTAQLRGTLDVAGLITGSVYLPQWRMILMVGYSTTGMPFGYLLYDFQGHDFFGGNKRKISISLPLHQVEGITSADGRKVFISNEYFGFGPVINPQKLHVFNLDSLTGDYIDSITSLEEIQAGAFIRLIYPNPTQNNLTIITDQFPVTFEIKDLTGKSIQKGTLSSKENEVDVSAIPRGAYIISAGTGTRNGIRFVRE